MRAAVIGRLVAVDPAREQHFVADADLAGAARQDLPRVIRDAPAFGDGEIEVAGGAGQPTGDAHALPAAVFRAIDVEGNPRAHAASTRPVYGRNDGLRARVRWTTSRSRPLS